MRAKTPVSGWKSFSQFRMDSPRSTNTIEVPINHIWSLEETNRHALHTDQAILSSQFAEKLP